MNVPPSITPSDLEKMVLHWLSTPAGSYLGSNYGSNIKNTLQRPQIDTDADEVLAKLRTDIPLLSALPAGSVNIYSYPHPDHVDRQQLVIEVAGIQIQV